MKANFTRFAGLSAAAACAAVALAIARAQEPQQSPVEAGVYQTGRLGVIAQPAPVTDPGGSVYRAGAYPLYTPELAAGEGRELVRQYCSLCHSTVYITMQPPLPRKSWDATVQKMIRTFGAPVPEDAARAITDYLATHYSPETRAR